MADLETKIMNFLKQQPSKAAQAISIARGVGLSSKKEVNPTLYKMNTQGLVSTDGNSNWTLMVSSKNDLPDASDRRLFSLNLSEVQGEDCLSSLNSRGGSVGSRPRVSADRLSKGSSTASSNADNVDSEFETLPGTSNNNTFSAQQEVVTYLQSCPNMSASRLDIEKSCNISDKKRVNKLLYSMSQAGDISKVENSSPVKWQLSQSGRAPSSTTGEKSRQSSEAVGAATRPNAKVPLSKGRAEDSPPAADYRLNLKTDDALTQPTDQQQAQLLKENNKLLKQNIDVMKKSIQLQSQKLLSERPIESLFRKDYKYIRKLGEGGFGRVYHVQKKDDEMEYAVKVVEVCDDQDRKKCLQEVKLLAKLDPKYVVRYYTSWFETCEPQYEDSDGSTSSAHVTDSKSISNKASDSVDENNGRDQETDEAVSSSAGIDFESDSLQSGNDVDEDDTDDDVADEEHTSSSGIFLYIQMELCPKSLRRRLDDFKDTGCLLKDGLKIFISIVEGVDYLHKRDLIHRDIKPENILFRGDEFSVTLCDFGLAKSFALSSSKQDDGSPSKGKKHTMAVGTRSYMAPEQFGDQYDQKVDIYPLGLIMLEIVCIFKTTNEASDWFKKLREGASEQNFPPEFRQKVKELMPTVQRMLAEDPTQRPSANDILAALRKSKLLEDADVAAVAAAED